MRGWAHARSLTPSSATRYRIVPRYPSYSDAGGAMNRFFLAMTMLAIGVLTPATVSAQIEEVRIAVRGLT